MISVCLADDHDLIRDGFSKLIAGEAGMTMTGAAATAEELFRLLECVACDVVILDIGLPDKNGLEVLKELRVWFPAKKVLILSMHPEERYAVRMIKDGASGYISKSAASEELIDAIRKIYHGDYYISEALAGSLASALGRVSNEKPHEKLSDREFEIMLRIGAGKSGSDIAAELSLSVNTINTYRRRLLDKMGMHSSAEVIQYVLQHHLIEYQVE